MIFEQCLRTACCTFLLMLFLPDGLEYACLAIVGGGSIAEISSFLFSCVLYFTDKTRAETKRKSGKPDENIGKKVFKTAFPVAFSGYVRSALVTIEHVLIPLGIEKSGSSRSASLSAYGTLHSMVFPIVLFPSAVVSAFSSLLIPEMSEAAVKNEKERIKSVAERVFRTTLVFSFFVSGAMLAFSNELGVCIYSSVEAGNYIRYIAPLIPVMYLDGAVDSMLKGLGEQVYSMNVNIADALVCVILVYTLLPPFGITGYMIVVYVSEIMNLSLSIIRLLAITAYRPDIVRLVLMPLSGVVVSANAAKIFSYLPLVTALPGISSLILSVAAFSAVFAAFMLCADKMLVSAKRRKSIKSVS